MFINAFVQGSSGVGSYGFSQNSTIQSKINASKQSSSYGRLIIIDTIGRFRFKTDMYFDVESAGEEWVLLSNCNNRLYAVGRSIKDAKVDLEETLNDFLEDYVLCDESELHESGLELRRWFTDNVEVISDDVA